MQENNQNRQDAENTKTEQAAGPAEQPKSTVAQPSLNPPLTAPGGSVALPHPYPAAQNAPKEKEPFAATAADACFAVGFFGIGLLFYSWMLETWQGWGVLVFCLFYAALLLGYSYAKRVQPGKYSWYWLALLLLTAISCALYPVGSLVGWRGLFLYAVAIYWCGSLFGINLEGKTGNLLVLDGINLLLCVPFRNFSLMVRSVVLWLKNRKKEATGSKLAWRRVRSVLLGLVICVPVIALVLPLLLEADAGGFGTMVDNLFGSLSKWLHSLWLDVTPIQVIVGFLAGCYLFGLAAGGAHKRYAKNFDAKKVRRGVGLLRILPGATVAAVLAVVALVYALFIGYQVPYFFSAFGGSLPEGFTNYAEYARAGFFELCRIAAINLGILLGANILSVTPRRESRILRGLNILLAGVTLLLLATAFSKMAMYIDKYGYTPKRVLTSVFMLFLAGVWVAAIVLQFREFSIARFGAVLGSSMFCLLCLSNMDGWITGANARLALEGRIDRFETSVARNVGMGALDTLLPYYEARSDALTPWLAEACNSLVQQGFDRKDAVFILAAEGFDELRQLEKLIDAVRWEAENATGQRYDTLAYSGIRATELPAAWATEIILGEAPE